MHAENAVHGLGGGAIKMRDEMDEMVVDCACG
jgi:hypothetical protein